MKSIVGKQYKTIDNSFSINLTEPIYRIKDKNYLNCKYLAGTDTTDRKAPIITTIVTEPFLMNIKVSEGSLALRPNKKEEELYKEYTFIIVKDEDNEYHNVLFDERGIID